MTKSRNRRVEHERSFLERVVAAELAMRETGIEPPLTDKDIATLLGVSRMTVTLRAERALRKLLKRTSVGYHD